MSITKRGLLRTMMIAAAIVFSAHGASAIDLSHEAFARTIGPTSIPIGHMEFCRRNRIECGPNQSVSEVEALSEQRWRQLVETNNRLNTEIVPITDLDYYQVGELWTYPDGYGDCEDFVLAKRRQLIQYGWDPSTLLIAVVRQSNGDGHAVLMVRTDRGDLVLDNLDSTIRVWRETPYQFIKRQSQRNAGEWVLIDDSRQVVTVASTN